MVLILYTKQEQRLSEPLFHQHLKRLPPDLQQKVRRYRRWQDAQASLLGKILLIEGLQLLGEDGETLIQHLQYTAFNRPYLPARPDFNISHSADYVLCALSNQCRVGIDIEKVRPIHLPDFRAQMTDSEWLEVNSAGDPLRAFYAYWTKKEAAIKAHGHGLSLPLQEIIIAEGQILLEGKAWPLHEVHLSSGFICHLVTDVVPKPEAGSAAGSILLKEMILA